MTLTGCVGRGRKNEQVSSASDEASTGREEERGSSGKSFNPFWTPTMVLSMRTTAKFWNGRSTYGPYGKLLFFLGQKGPYNKSGTSCAPHSMCESL